MKEKYKVLGALALYIAFASFVTFPFVIDPGNTLTAPLWGDVSASVSKFHAIVQSHSNPLLDANYPWVSLPEGPVNNVGVDRVSFFSTIYLWLGSMLLGALTAHSLMTFLGYILTAFVAFLLVRKITGSSMAGLVAGLVFGFSSHMYGIAHAAMTYTHMWLYLLPIWAFWALAKDGFSKWRVALAAASIVPAVFWTPYFMFHVLIVGGAALVVSLYYLWRRHGWRLMLLTAASVGAFWLLVLAAYRYMGLHSPSSIVPARSMEEIYQQSAHPLMYFLPGVSSWFGNELLVKLVPRASSINLYVGISATILATIGLVFVYRTRRDKDATVKNVRIAALIALLAGIGCFVFSLPPTVHVAGVTLPTPNYIVAHTVPALRAGQRFVMPLMGCMAILAGIGAWYLMRPLRNRGKALLAALLLLIIGIDTWALPPDNVTVIPTHPALAKLRQLPEGPVAQYDRGSMINFYLPCLYNREYNKPLINDCGLGRSGQLAGILEMPLCDQFTRIKEVGGEYIIFSPRDKKVVDCLQTSKYPVVAEDDEYRVVTLQ